MTKVIINKKKILNENQTLLKNCCSTELFLKKKKQAWTKMIVPQENIEHNLTIETC